MKILQQINEWVQKGYDIRYMITDQVENGYKTAVEEGTMPRYTYTFFIDVNSDMVWDYSVDTLEEGFKLALEWLDGKN